MLPFNRLYLILFVSNASINYSIDRNWDSRCVIRSHLKTSAGVNIHQVFACIKSVVPNPSFTRSMKIDQCRLQVLRTSFPFCALRLRPLITNLPQPNTNLLPNFKPTAAPPPLPCLFRTLANESKPLERLLIQEKPYPSPKLL